MYDVYYLAWWSKTSPGEMVDIMTCDCDGITLYAEAEPNPFDHRPLWNKIVKEANKVGISPADLVLVQNHISVL